MDSTIAATDKIRELVKIRNELNEVIDYFRSQKQFRTCDLIRSVKKLVQNEIQAEAERLEEMLG